MKRQLTFTLDEVKLLCDALAQATENSHPDEVGYSSDEEKEKVEGYYGGMDALDRRAAILYQRMFGITPFDGERRFDVSLTLPGTIVDANGTLETESRVRWSFRLQEAFAFGNAMRCRSLAPDLAAQRAVLGSARLTSREGMLRYASMVEGDDELLKVVRQAIAEKRAAPIEAYHSKLAADQKQADRAAKVAKLMALLGVTVK